MSVAEPLAGLFVTGTDTGVGKTFVSIALMSLLRDAGLPVHGFKPVAAGCEITADGMRNDDALALQAMSDGRPGYGAVNPVALRPPIAPHLAAADAGLELASEPLVQHVRKRCPAGTMAVVEGAGGWLVPLNREQTLADVAVSLGLPVVLVVAVRLGCINQALLTAGAIEASGARLGGWIANRPTAVDVERPEGQIDAIRERINAPLLGIVQYHAVADARHQAACLDRHALLRLLNR